MLVFFSNIFSNKKLCKYESNNWLVLSCVFILPLFFCYKYCIYMKSGKWCTRLNSWSIFLSIVDSLQQLLLHRCGSFEYYVKQLVHIFSNVLSFIPRQYITFLKHTCRVCLFLFFLSLKLDVKRLSTARK